MHGLRNLICVCVTVEDLRPRSLWLGLSLAKMIFPVLSRGLWGVFVIQLLKTGPSQSLAAREFLFSYFQILDSYYSRSGDGPLETCLDKQQQQNNNNNFKKDSCIT